ncbi:predicted protein [Sclerotinia sclerotiorum 1980 UF-70]|uniref:Uncharacterized protein n=1 Tax=Sclerotinia sclerotiorum (strain ATCC 18683 / 1980 / Ss-1) TaxID=665079 RepID=A7ESX1_SCLS1|nr:predicted protein [Sclerotinia sclerotiorum 1980 UF-70]EDN92563.1 predicted protein [Sclerotinia sclerotiorum 1980 UF-70]
MREAKISWLVKENRKILYPGPEEHFSHFGESDDFNSSNRCCYEYGRCDARKFGKSGKREKLGDSGIVGDSSWDYYGLEIEKWIRQDFALIQIQLTSSQSYNINILILHPTVIPALSIATTIISSPHSAFNNKAKHYAIPAGRHAKKHNTFLRWYSRQTGGRRTAQWVLLEGKF